jgi:hypothetical protein
MIKFRRGKTAAWYKQKTLLEDGQPGYDKDKNKIKIGDGKSSWSELPSASGLSAEEILSAETAASNNRKSLKTLIKDLVSGNLDEVLKRESPAIITYGTKSPFECGDKKPDGSFTGPTGQIYLQHYDAEPEVDYVVESGVGNGWVYQKWSSGIAKCSMSLVVTTTVQTELGESLFKNSTEIPRIKYPFNFISTAELKTPAEVATVQSPDGLVWLATAKNGTNTLKESASYYIVSANKQDNSANYKISISVTGFWR